MIEYGNQQKIRQHFAEMDALIARVIADANVRGGHFSGFRILPNGKTLNFLAKVESSRKSSKPGKIFLGMTFLDTSCELRGDDSSLACVLPV